MALSGCRSRERSSDYDRSRRQHQVLRAIFEKALSLNMIAKVPQLYAQDANIAGKPDPEQLEWPPMAVLLFNRVETSEQREKSLENSGPENLVSVLGDKLQDLVDLPKGFLG